MTPVNAVWLVVMCAIMLNLIAIGSTQTATAIFNITAPALDLSYVAVIFAHLYYGYKLKFVDESQQYSLGKWGKPVNIIAIIWVCFISVVLFFPTTVPITVLNMYEPRFTLFVEEMLDLNATLASAQAAILSQPSYPEG